MPGKKRVFLKIAFAGVCIIFAVNAGCRYSEVPAPWPLDTPADGRNLCVEGEVAEVFRDKTGGRDGLLVVLRVRDEAGRITRVPVVWPRGLKTPERAETWRTAGVIRGGDLEAYRARPVERKTVP